MIKAADHNLLRACAAGPAWGPGTQRHTSFSAAEPRAFTPGWALTWQRFLRFVKGRHERSSRSSPWFTPRCPDGQGCPSPWEAEGLSPGWVVACVHVTRLAVHQKSSSCNAAYWAVGVREELELKGKFHAVVTGPRSVRADVTGCIWTCLPRAEGWRERERACPASRGAQVPLWRWTGSRERP